jgi:hypothetical protein
MLTLKNSNYKACEEKDAYKNWRVEALQKNKTWKEQIT